MNKQSDQIECDTHGKGYETFVCKHLATNESNAWHSSPPIDGDQWPSAWCERCHKHFLKQNEWNKKSESAADLANNVRLLCHKCYKSLKKCCDVNYV